MRGRRRGSGSRVPWVRRLAVVMLAIAGLAAAAGTAAAGQEGRQVPNAVPAGAGNASGRPRAARAARTVAQPQAADQGGLFLLGPVTATWSGHGAEITVSQISNEYPPPGGRGFELGLALLATPMVPNVYDSLIATDGWPPGWHVLAGASIPNIDNGTSLYNVDTGLLAYNPPPSGCYFVTVALTQDVELIGTVLLDFRPLSAGGEQDPGGSGYDLFSFAGTDCAAAANGSCSPGPGTLCLERYAGDRRFQVTAEYSDPVSHAPATAAPFSLTGLGVGDAGLFSFFGTRNPEVLVKVLDGCALNSKFWVFLGPTTNVGFTVTVTDTVTGHVATYHNDDQVPAKSVQDTNALPCP